MLVHVKFGDGQTKIFNPVCLNCNLLWAIKTKYKIHHNDIVDVSDEAGAVKQLHQKLLDYATDSVEDRETLILLRVEREDSDDDKPQLRYIPLVTELAHDQEFLALLNPKPRKGHANRKGEDSKSGRRPSKQGSKLSVNAPPGVNMSRRASNRRGSVITMLKK